MDSGKKGRPPAKRKEVVRQEQDLGDGFTLITSPPLDDAPPPSSPRETDTPKRPKVEVTVRVDELRDQALEMLARSGVPLYHRDGQLVEVLEVATPRLRSVQPGHLMALLSSVADWQRWDRREKGLVPCLPPRPVLGAVLEAGRWPQLREIRGLVQTPTLRPDGSILSAPGYDPSTKLYHVPTLPPLQVPETPTAAELRAAIEALAEVVCDFPFAHEAGFSAWLSLLLTYFARQAVDGFVPMFLVDANIRGSGKSLLVDAAHMIAFGRLAERGSHAKEDEEERKALLAIATAGYPSVLFDNVDRPLGTASLDAALTSGSVRGRKLGTNDMLTAAWTAVVAATGNNIRLKGDLVRRCLRMRLLSQEERPEAREGLRHQPLLPWVASERPRLATAALTLLRAYCAAGRPDQRLSTWGSFEAWRPLICGAIVWLGLPDPLLCNDVEHDDSDDDAAALGDLLQGWADLARPCGGILSCGEALRRLAAKAYSGGFLHPAPQLRDALAQLFGAELPSVRQLGAVLKRYRERPVAGRHLRRRRMHEGYGWCVAGVGDVEPDPSEPTGQQELPSTQPPADMR